MQNEKGKNWIIIGLVAISAILAVTLILLLTNNSDSEKETPNNVNTYDTWVDYLLETDIQEITVTRNRNKMFGDNEDYNKTITLTVEELKQEFKKLNNYKLQKMYAPGLGGVSKDEMKISYLANGKEYNFAIIFGNAIPITGIDEGLLNALNNSDYDVINENLLNENPALINDYAFFLEKNLFSIFDKYFEDELNNKQENNNIENNNAGQKYKEYKKFDEITLSNGTEWLVIKDSDEKQDYVTLLSKESFVFGETNTFKTEVYFVKTSDDEIFQLDKDLYNTYETYDNCILKKLLEDRVTKNIPVKLKEVDGYKIRLITVEEILSLDNAWAYDKETDTYNYSGNNLASYLNPIFTMTRPQQPLEPRRASLYSVYTTTNYETTVSNTTIAPYASITRLSLATKPVINVYKNELN